MAHVYHFTSILRLPWIVMSGELRPTIYGDDVNRHLWATSDPAGNCSALPFRMLKYSRRDELLVVRFTLPAAGFVPWNRIKKTLSSEDVAQWEAAAVDWGEDPSAWRLRCDPVPLSSAVRVDAKPPGYSWQRIKATSEHCYEVCEGTMGFIIGGFHFYSMACGDNWYDVPDRDELREMFEENEDHLWD